MPTRYLQAFNRNSALEGTVSGQNDAFALYIMPLGQTPASHPPPYEPIRNRWERWLGPQPPSGTPWSYDCVVAPPIAGAPVWGSFSLPTMPPGSFSLHLIAPATPGDGSSIIYSKTSGPAWLNITSGTGALDIAGEVPFGQTGTINLSVLATQADGKSTPKVFSFTPIPIPIYARVVVTGNNLISTFLGGNLGANIPLEILSGPSGYAGNVGKVAMSPTQVPIGGKTYFYQYDYNDQILTGNYQFDFETVYGHLYGQLDITSGSNASVEITLTSTPPVQTAPIITIDAVYESVQNHGPTVTNPAQFTFVTQGVAFSYPIPFASSTPEFTDPEGDTITYRLRYAADGLNYSDTLPGWLTVSGNHFGGTPPVTGSQYTLKMQILATDIYGAIAIDQFNLIVNYPTTP